MAETLQELIAELSTMDSARRADTDRLNTAYAGYERITNRSYYSTEEAHRASYAEHLPAVQAVETEISRSAELRERRQREIMRQTASEFPVIPDALADRVASLRPMIREDAEKLPLPALLARTRHALQVQDRASMYLYHRYVKMRLASSRLEQGEEPAVTKARSELGALLRDIDSRLVSREVAQVHAQALSGLTEDSHLRSKATARARSQQTYTFQGRNEVPWPQGAG